MVTRPKILCIDDDPGITRSICLRLACFDVDVLSAASSTDGIWIALNTRPDVIITDLRMPDGGGDYLAECLQGRLDTCDIPVIVLTGKTDYETERWMQLLGVKVYLRKPASLAKLQSALEQYIQLRAYDQSPV